MIDRQKVETILRRRFPGAEWGQIAAAARDSPGSLRDCAASGSRKIVRGDLARRSRGERGCDRNGSSRAERGRPDVIWLNDEPDRSTRNMSRADTAALSR